MLFGTPRRRAVAHGERDIPDLPVLEIAFAGMVTVWPVAWTFCMKYQVLRRRRVSDGSGPPTDGVLRPSTPTMCIVQSCSIAMN